MFVCGATMLEHGSATYLYTISSTQEFYLTDDGTACRSATLCL